MYILRKWTAKGVYEIVVTHKAEKILISHQAEKIWTYDQPYKVPISACAANCTTGIISAIMQWKGEGESNAQVRLHA